MSTITTLSKFYFGTVVTNDNFAIDFDEGGPELLGSLRPGSYTPTEYAAEWQRAMREAGTQAYVVTFNRNTRTITVSAPLIFTLRRGTGSRLASSAWTMAGFGTGANLTGVVSYTGANPCGSVYYPQYIVSDYQSDEHNLVKENSTVNTTPAGLVQIASFGDGSRIQMNIRLITNKLGLKNENFVENANGVLDAMTFVSYLLKKQKVEFMPDKAVTGNFLKLFLEGTKDDRDGKKFSLKNMKVPDFYETGTLTFRKVLT